MNCCSMGLNSQCSIIGDLDDYEEVSFCDQGLDIGSKTESLLFFLCEISVMLSYVKNTFSSFHLDAWL